MASRKKLLAWCVGIVTVLGAVVVYPIATNLASSRLEDFLKGHGEFAWPFVVAVIVFAGISWSLWRGHQQAQLRGEYGLFVKSEELRPEDLGFEVVAAKAEPADVTRRPFVKSVYIPRVALRAGELQGQPTARTYSEAELRTLMEEGRSILLIGKPTEGKTRTLYEIARGLQGYLVVQPKDPLPSNEALELLRGQKVLCLFDDINTAVEKRIDLFEFYQRVQQVASYRALAAACRDGTELTALKLKLSTSPVQKLYECFSDRFVLRPASSEEMTLLAQRLNQRNDSAYLSLGDVCMRNAFELMQRRFESLEELDRECLWTLQLLAEAGVEELHRRRILAILKHQYGREIQLTQLRQPLGRLRENGFLVGGPDEDPVVPEAAFISGTRAQRNYRDGVPPERDLPQLIDALRKEGDPGGLNNVAYRRYQLGKPDEAFALWSGTFDAFASDADTKKRADAALAAVNTAVYFHVQERYEEALPRYADVLHHFGCDGTTGVRAEVARALYNSGAALKILGRTEEFLQRFAELSQRFAGDMTLSVRELVGNALYNSGVTLENLGRTEEALQRYTEVVQRFKSDTTPGIRELVALALNNSGVTLGNLGRAEDALQRYAEIAERFEGDTTPNVRGLVAEALFNSGVTLGNLGRAEDALQRYAEIAERFEGDTTPNVREQVAKALVNSSVTLENLDRGEEALQCYTEIIRRFADDSTPVIVEIVQAVRTELGTNI